MDQKIILISVAVIFFLLYLFVLSPRSRRLSLGSDTIRIIILTLILMFLSYDFIMKEKYMLLVPVVLAALALTYHFYNKTKNGNEDQSGSENLK